MEPQIVREEPSNEHSTPERCHILELWNSVEEGISIARARVEPGETTQRHHLKGVDEKYLIIKGTGLMELGGLQPAEVGAGDLVVIPAGTPQRIANTGVEDLVFYCLCTPGFHGECYIVDA